VYQEDWKKLKRTLEQHHHCHFLDAIIDNVPGTETLDGSQSLKWFSEYEFLGSWILTQRPVNWLFQQRFGIESVEDLCRLDPTKYTSICDHSSGQNPALGFNDWHTGNIPNYSRCLEILQTHFPGLDSTKPAF